MKFTVALEKAYEIPGMEFEIKSTIGDTPLKMRFRKQEDSKSLFLEMNDGGDGKYTHLTGISEFDMESDWQPVLQEVTWNEALEAWSQKDKTIKCILPTETAEFLCINKEHVIDRFQSNIKLLSKLIYHGKWYILED